MYDKDFIANLSHDLKAPTNSIMGFTDLALSIEENEKVKEYLNKITLASKHLLTIVNNILDFSKDSKKMEVNYTICSIDDILNEVKNILEGDINRKGISLIINKKSLSSDFVFVDTLKLKQVLINLTSNAIKYSFNGSKIYLNVIENKIDDDFSVFVFTIKDEGIGMNDDFIKYAFDSYARDLNVNGVEGSGLGLSIVKEIIDLMNGEIELESEINKGTEVSFKLKLKTLNKEKALNKRILVVDDDCLNRDLIKELLNDYNYGIEEAENGKQAFEKIINNKENYYNLMLIDQNMPLMNAYECIKLIRNINDERSKLNIILMSGNKINDEVLDCGFNDYIEKPFKINELIKKIKDIIM